MKDNNVVPDIFQKPATLDNIKLSRHDKFILILRIILIFLACFFFPMEALIDERLENIETKIYNTYGKSLMNKLIGKDFATSLNARRAIYIILEILGGEYALIMYSSFLYVLYHPFMAIRLVYVTNAVYYIIIIAKMLIKAKRPFFLAKVNETVCSTSYANPICSLFFCSFFFAYAFIIHRLEKKREILQEKKKNLKVSLMRRRTLIKNSKKDINKIEASQANLQPLLKSNDTQEELELMNVESTVRQVTSLPIKTKVILNIIYISILIIIAFFLSLILTNFFHQIIYTICFTFIVICILIDLDDKIKSEIYEALSSTKKIRAMKMATLFWVLGFSLLGLFMMFLTEEEDLSKMRDNANLNKDCSKYDVLYIGNKNTFRYLDFIFGSVGAFWGAAFALENKIKKWWSNDDDRKKIAFKVIIVVLANAVFIGLKVAVNALEFAYDLCFALSCVVFLVHYYFIFGIVPLINSKFNKDGEQEGLTEEIEKLTIKDEDDFVVVEKKEEEKEIKLEEDTNINNEVIKIEQEKNILDIDIKKSKSTEIKENKYPDLLEKKKSELIKSLKEDLEVPEEDEAQDAFLEGIAENSSSESSSDSLSEGE